MLHYFDELSKITEQQFRLFHRYEMASLIVIRTMHQIRVLLDQLPVQRMNKVMSESGTSGWHMGRNVVQIVGLLLGRKTFAVQSNGRRNRMRKIVDHDIVQDGVFENLIERWPSAIGKFPVGRISPGGEFLIDVRSQSDRVLGQGDT